MNGKETFPSVLKQLTQPGEHSLFFSGEVGQLEAILSIPKTQSPLHGIALLGHPHSLQGGTMNNKVVTTLVRVFGALGVPSIRFNFRGVGHSQGAYDEGLGESRDMLILAQHCQEAWPDISLVFAGFSFGSYVAYRAAAQSPHRLLISIAPPVHHYNYHEFRPTPAPWIIAQGDSDEVVPCQHVYDFVAQASPPITLLEFAETGHFFHGKLIELKTQLTNAVDALGIL